MPMRTRALVLAVALVLPVVAPLEVGAQDAPTTTAPSLLIEGTTPSTTVVATASSVPATSDETAEDGGDSTSTRLWVAVGLLLIFSAVVAWLTFTYWRVTRPPERSERSAVDLDDLVGPGARRR